MLLWPSRAHEVPWGPGFHLGGGGGTITEAREEEARWGVSVAGKAWPQSVQKPEVPFWE